MANEIKFRVLGDVKDLEGQLSKAGKAFDKIGKSSAIAFAGLTATAAGFINAARGQEQAIQALNQALKNTGNYSDSASKDLINYASALQSVSLFGDETIIQAQSLIASFGFEGEVLKGLTRATLDLAQAKGMDLNAAADLVAKSVGSSTNALSRYGVEVTGTVGSTDRASSAIKNINKLFGGQAKAATDGLGSIEQLKNAMGDLGEEIGFALAPTVIEITKSLKSMIEQMQKNPEIAKTAAEILKLGVVVTGTIAGVWALNRAWIAVSGTLTAMIPILTAIATSPVFLAGTAIASIGGLAKATWDWYKAEEAVGRELEQQTAQLDKAMAARGVTAGQVAADARMRIEIVKNATDLEISEETRRLESVKAIEDEIAAYKDGYKEISAIRTQQEVDDYITKIQQKRDADIEYWNIVRQIYDENNALTIEKQTEFENEIAKIKEEYSSLELVAKQQQQTKLSALDQKGAEIAKQVNKDKIGSLKDTLQQAAQLNSKFARAYQVVAIGEAIMSTASGVARALKDYPFPASLAVAALVGAAGAVQIATIASQSFAVGTPEVPKDMNADIHKGEMIVPATFSDAIRSGELTLSGAGSTTNENGIVIDLSGSTFNGVTEGFVRDIFERAGEMLNNRTLVALPA